MGPRGFVRLPEKKDESKGKDKEKSNRHTFLSSSYPFLYDAIQELAGEDKPKKEIEHALELAYRKNERHVNKKAMKHGITVLSLAASQDDPIYVEFLIRKSTLFYRLNPLVANKDDSYALSKIVGFEDNGETKPDLKTERRRKNIEWIEQRFVWDEIVDVLTFFLLDEFKKALETAAEKNNFWFIQYFFHQHRKHFDKPTSLTDFFYILLKEAVGAAIKFDRKNIFLHLAKNYNSKGQIYFPEKIRQNDGFRERADAWAQEANPAFKMTVSPLLEQDPVGHLEIGRVKISVRRGSSSS